jgi:hypothetical protein
MPYLLVRYGASKKLRADEVGQCLLLFGAEYFVLRVIKKCKD